MVRVAGVVVGGLAETPVVGVTVDTLERAREEGGKGAPMEGKMEVVEGEGKMGAAMAA